MVPFFTALLLLIATSAGAGLAESVSAVLERSPDDTSHAEPLAHDHLTYDELAKAPTWSVTGWEVIKAGGHTLIPGGDGALTPWWSSAPGSSPITPQILAYLVGGTVGSSAATPPRLVASLMLAGALEDVVGRITGTADLGGLLEPIQTLAREPASVEAREQLFDTVLGMDDRRARKLWDRGTFGVACGLLVAANSPTPLALEEREALAESALTLLHALLELRPDASPALHLIGLTHLWQAAHRPSEAAALTQLAVDSFDRGLRADPQDPHNYVALALHYRLQGAPQHALAVLASAMASIDDFKKPWKAQVLRHTAAIHWELASDDRPWALATSFRLYRRALKEHPTVETATSTLTVWDALADTGAELLEDPGSTRVTMRLELARRVLELADSFRGGPVSEEAWLTGHHVMLEELFDDATHHLLAADDQEVRDELIGELHWAWNQYAQLTADHPAAIQPSLELTQRTRDLVDESNSRRWKARRLKMGRYDARLGKEL